MHNRDGSSQDPPQVPDASFDSAARITWPTLQVAQFPGLVNTSVSCSCLLPLPEAGLIKALNVRVHIGGLVEGRSGGLLSGGGGGGGGGALTQSDTAT